MPAHKNDASLLNAVDEVIKTYGVRPTLLGSEEFADCFFNGVMVFDVLKREKAPHSKKKKNRPEKPPIDYGASMGKASKRLGLGYVVFNAAYRKDMKDGGASYVAHYLRDFKKNNPGAIADAMLSPEFSRSHIPFILKERPDLISYNVPINKLNRPAIRRIRNAIAAARKLSKNKLIRAIFSIGKKTRLADVFSALRIFRKAGADMVVLHAAEDWNGADGWFFELCEREAHYLGFRHVIAKPKLNLAYDLPEFISSIH